MGANTDRPREPQQEQPRDEAAQATPPDIQADQTCELQHDDTADDSHEWLRSLLADPVPREVAHESEPQCRDLVERMRDIDAVCRLADALSDAESDVEWQLPKELGQFVLFEKLGRGGMGQVFKARHKQLGRVQVVKILLHQRRLDAGAIARFYKEMRAVGQLNHPNLVAAQHADEADGVPYLVMDYVDGYSLADLIQRAKRAGELIPIPVACELIRQAALGLQHAHGQGIVHRDIKPENLMVDRSGTVKVLDLGLARIHGDRGTESDEQPSAFELTEAHHIVGTPDYMAPEQIRSSRDVDARADVYSLGATLFTLLTGRVLHPAPDSEERESAFEKLMRIAQAPLPDVRAARPDIPEGLAELITQCLQKNLTDRLPSAGQLAQRLSEWSSADALRDWLHRQAKTETTDEADLPTVPLVGRGQPDNITQLPATEIVISDSAAATSPVSDVPKNTEAARGRRPPVRRIAIAAACLGPILLLAGIIFRLQLPDGGTLVVECDDPNADITLSAIKDGKSTPLQLKQKRGQFELSEGTWKLEIKGLDADQFEISENRVVISKGDVAKLRITRKAADGSPRDQLVSKDPTDPKTNDPASPPDARPPTIPAWPPARTNGPSDDEILQRLASVDWSRPTFSPANPDQSPLLPGYAQKPPQIDGIPYAWQIVPRGEHLGKPKVWFSPRGTFYAASNNNIFDPFVRIFERETGRLVGVFHALPRFHRQVSWAADESLLAISSGWGGREDWIEICRPDGVPLAAWQLPSTKDRSPNDYIVAWNPDATRLLIASPDGLEQWTPDGRPVATFVPPQHGASASNLLWGNSGISLRDSSRFWSPDGSRFAVPVDNEVRVYDKDGGEPLAVLQDNDGVPIQWAWWHPSGEKILTNDDGQQHFARLWTLDGQFTRFQKKDPRSGEHFGGFSPDGLFFFTAGGDPVTGHLYICDLTGQLVSEIDGTLLNEASATGDQIMGLWHAPDRILLFSPYTAGARTVELSPSGRLMSETSHPHPVPQYSMSWTQRDEAFDAVAGSETSAWRVTWGVDSAHDGSLVYASPARSPKFAAFSPTRREFLQSVNSSLKLVKEDGSVHSLPVTGLNATGIAAWSPDGNRIAVAFSAGNNDVRIAILDRNTDDVLAELKGHRGPVYGLVWHPDGRHLASWDTDETAPLCIWDTVESTEPLRRLKAATLARHNFPAGSAQWSPDGKWLAYPASDSTLALLPFPEGEDRQVEVTHSNPVWWRPDSQALLTQKELVFIDGHTEPIFDAGDDDPVSFKLWEQRTLDWLGGNRFVASHPGACFIVNDLQSTPDVIPFPCPTDFGQPFGTSPRRCGMNAQTLSPSKRYYIQRSDVADGPPEWSQNVGDVYLVDVEQKKHLWTGIFYSDGTQVRIDPNGRVVEPPQDFDRHLAYVVQYGRYGRTLPLTRLQFASRIGLSSALQFVQRVLDYGGRIRVSGYDQWLAASDFRDARDLPAVEQVVGVDLAQNVYLEDDDLQNLGLLTSLEELDLSRDGAALDRVRDSVTLAGLSGLENLKALRRLKLSGMPIDGSLGKYLPPSLEELDVHQTAVTDFLLYDLQQLESLKQLDLRGTKFSAAGVAKLQKALPQCNILSDSGASN